MHHKLKITFRMEKSIFICPWSVKVKTNYFNTNYTFSINFCELLLFPLVSSEVVICLATLVFYHTWLIPCTYIQAYFTVLIEIYALTISIMNSTYIYSTKCISSVPI